jgi:branched-chain amino acid transport system ATP-binding protein
VIAELTVEENLRLGGLWRRARDASDVFELFPRLQERLNQPASTLSGGERQMLVIGRALMARPRLLLLDEPSLGLAPRVTAQIMGLLRDLRERTGLTVVLVEQNARSALSVADRAIVLALGRVVASDETLDDQLRHAYLGF